MSYFEQQVKTKLKVGDEVKIIRAPEKSDGWNGYWDDLMESCIGNTATIESVCKNGFHLVGYGKIYPYFILKRTKKLRRFFPIQITMRDKTGVTA